MRKTLEQWTTRKVLRDAVRIDRGHTDKQNRFVYVLDKHLHNFQSIGLRCSIQPNLTLSVFPFLSSHTRFLRIVFPFFFLSIRICCLPYSIRNAPLLTVTHYYCNKISIFLQLLFNKTKLFIDYFICENNQRQHFFLISFCE